MKKYYVDWNRTLKKYETREVDVIDEKEETITFKYGNEVITKNKVEVFDTREYADIIRKERKTSKFFKNQRLKGKGRYYTCPCCGRKIRKEEVTIDHKIPKRYFQQLAKDKYNVEDLRLVEELWKQCWNYNNLQLICRDCNQRKGSSRHMLERYIAIKSYNHKKYESVNRGCRKVRIVNNNLISKDLEEDILKRYGNTFDIKYIK